MGSALCIFSAVVILMCRSFKNPFWIEKLLDFKNSLNYPKKSCTVCTMRSAPCIFCTVFLLLCRSDSKTSLLMGVQAREHFVFTDQDGLLYHFIVEGNMIKDGSKIPPDVSVFCYFYCIPC